MTRYINQVFILVIVVAFFLFPVNTEASTTFLIEGKPQSIPVTQIEYLPNVNLSIVESDAELDLIASKDSERTIFQSFQLPHYDEKWHIHRFNFAKAWGYEPIRPVKVAIIDTGASLQQLTDPRFRNGRNFVNKLEQAIDDNGHGTALASIILDVVGPYPVEIIPIKAADSTGSFTVSNIVKAIDYAIEQKVDILNLSFGAKNPHDAEQQAINQAIAAGIDVFSSSGNTGRREYYYPASYPNIISVGAITEELIRASFSSYNNLLDFVAPGTNLYVLRHDLAERYTTIDGTSFATAYFTGQYAVLKANSLEVSTAALPIVATDLGPAGYDNEYGHGMLEIDKVLEAIRGKAWQTITTNEQQKTWTIRLTKKIKPDQALAQHIKIYDATLIEQPISIIATAEHMIEVTPKSPLHPGEYWLVINASLQAKSGQQLKQPAVLKFIVE